MKNFKYTIILFSIAFFMMFGGLIFAESVGPGILQYWIGVFIGILSGVLIAPSDNSEE